MTRIYRERERGGRRKGGRAEERERKRGRERKGKILNCILSAIYLLSIGVFVMREIIPIDL